ncbi:hypothetical protein FRC15_005789 [Serendipita sp. 397]|nr:hypothetical protein FRC15_005789 [Serendipita sp. 397]
MSFAELAAELNKIPPFTRITMLSALLITAPIMLKLVRPFHYSFDWSLITGKLQIHRLYTSIFIPWRLDDPIKWLFDLFLLYRYLLQIETKSYDKRLPDMVWQFFWSMATVMLLCYPLHFPFFWTPFIGFVVYFSSRLSPNETTSIYGLITISIKWFPYIIAAFDMVMSPMIGCGTIAGMVVAQALFMLEYDAPSEANPTEEPRLKQRSILRAPNWLVRLLVAPEANRPAPSKRVYGQASAPAGRGFGDDGRGTNVASSSSGYNWGQGRRLGET